MSGRARSRPLIHVYVQLHFPSARRLRPDQSLERGVALRCVASSVSLHVWRRPPRRRPALPISLPTCYPLPFNRPRASSVALSPTVIVHAACAPAVPAASPGDCCNQSAIPHQRACSSPSGHGPGLPLPRLPTDSPACDRLCPPCRPVAHPFRIDPQSCQPATSVPATPLLDGFDRVLRRLRRERTVERFAADDDRAPLLSTLLEVPLGALRVRRQRAGRPRPPRTAKQLLCVCQLTTSVLGLESAWARGSVSCSVPFLPLSEKSAFPLPAFQWGVPGIGGSNGRASCKLDDEQESARRLAACRFAACLHVAELDGDQAMHAAAVDAGPPSMSSARSCNSAADSRPRGTRDGIGALVHRHRVHRRDHDAMERVEDRRPRSGHAYQELVAKVEGGVVIGDLTSSANTLEPRRRRRANQSGAISTAAPGAGSRSATSSRSRRSSSSPTASSSSVGANSNPDLWRAASGSGSTGAITSRITLQHGAGLPDPARRRPPPHSALEDAL